MFDRPLAGHRLATGNRFGKWTAPALVFIAILVFGGLATYAAYDAARAAELAQFRVIAQNAVGRIEVRLKQHIALLQATRAFFLANGAQLDRTDFRTFASHLDPAQTLPGIQGLGFARVVKRDQTDEVEKQIAANYGIERSVWPATTESIRAVIMLLEPSDTRNSTALAYDMFADPTRRAAMQAAIATGQPSASGPVELVQEITNRKQIGFLVYLPVFASEMAKAGSVENDNGGEDIAGFIYAPFRTGDLFVSVVNSNVHLPVTMSVTDTTDGRADLIYEDQDFGATSRFTSLAATETIEVAGRTWRFHVLPGPTYQASQARRLSLGIALLLAALAMTMALLTQAAMARHAAAEALKEQAEKDLLEKELILQEMKHRIKNSLGRVLAISRQTAKDAGNIDEFHASFSARLQAMATAQDMLTKSRWQRADLRALLVQELKQVFDQDDIDGSLRGPEVQLNERGAQAFGLVFHELATNALKYGATRPSDLSVIWSISPATAPAELLLKWQETLPGGVAEPEASGFGTKLVDLNIGMELGGSVKRRFGADGITIELRVPLRAVTS